MSDARQHHFVPQGYLRGFAKGHPAYPDRSQCFVTDLTLSKSYPTSIRNIGGRRDFNRIEADNADPNALEVAYGHFESQVAPAIKRIAKSKTFGGEDKILVLNLIALMATRNPRLRKTWSGFMDRVYRGVAQMSVGTKERYESLVKRSAEKDPVLAANTPLPYEQVRDFLQSGEYDVVTHQNTHIRLELDTFETVLKTLMARKWILQVANDKAGDFITSDHPVILASTKQSPSPLMRAGHGMTNTMLLFPLTRRVALFGSFETQDGVVPVGNRIVAQLNSMVIDHAEDQVYAYDSSFQYIKKGNLHPGADLCRDEEALRRVDDED